MPNAALARALLDRAEVRKKKTPAKKSTASSPRAEKAEKSATTSETSNEPSKES